MSSFRGIFVLPIGLALLACAVSAAVGTNAELLMWRRVENGGLNALYCYLRTLDVSCDYTELTRAATPPESRDTALGLAKLAARHGHSLQLRSLTFDELDRMELPLIVHLDDVSPDAGSFAVLFARSDSVLYLVNGPFATIQSISHENFRRMWSGVALLPVRDRMARVQTVFAGAAVGVMSGGAVILLRKRRSRA